MYKRIFVLAVTALALSVSLSIADEIKIATGATFIKAIIDPIRGPFKAKTGIDIRILGSGSPPASLSELEKGNAEAAGASLSMKTWLEQAKKAGVPAKEIGAYTTYIPMTEKSLVMVNSGNKVTSLSKEQLKGIFTGKILNWKEVGGDDAPILVVWPSLASGILGVFQSKALDNEPVTKNIYDVPTISDVPAAISNTPEAIGLVNHGSTEKNIKDVSTGITLERPLTLAYKGTPSASLQKLLDFLKQEGKQYYKD